MPPKGWKKSEQTENEGTPVVETRKETNAISITDLLMPKSTINRLAKSSAEGFLISQDSATALQRSTTVFVSFLNTMARERAKEQGRKTVSAEDVLHVAANMGLNTQEITTRLDAWTEHKKAKKTAKEESDNEAEPEVEEENDAKRQKTETAEEQ